MLDLRKTGLCAAAIGCGVLAAAAASPLPELSPEKRQLHFEELFRNLDPDCLGAGYAAARQAGDTQEALPPDRPLFPRTAAGLAECRFRPAPV